MTPPPASVSGTAAACVPYAASLGYYTGLLRGDAAPADAAPDAICHTLIAAPQGHSGATVTLTVPLAGGRRGGHGLPAAARMVSLHGRWPHVHLGALAASYGRTPYYRHYIGAVAEALDLAGAPGGVTLGRLSAALDAVVRRALPADALAALRQTAAADPRRLLALAAEAAAHEPGGVADTRLSMLHYLFRYGPQTIFFLARAFL